MSWVYINILLLGEFFCGSHQYAINSVVGGFRWNGKHVEVTEEYLNI